MSIVEPNSTQLIGFSAAGLTSIAFLPQLIKTWKTKSAEDVSYVMLSLFIIGVFLWIIYGLRIKEFPIIIANSVTLFLNLGILLIKTMSNNKFNSLEIANNK